MARVLIIREAEAGRETAETLFNLGHESVLLPLEAVVPLQSAPPGGNWDGFVVTSAKAVDPLAKSFPSDSRPVFAVGAATAEALRAAGFVHILAGSGTAASLPPIVETTFGAGETPRLLYAAGRNRSGSLERAFEAAGIGFGTWDVYDIVPLMPDRASAEVALGEAPVDAVLILSQGQAEAYGRLVARLKEASSRQTTSAPPRLLCLSERIAAALPAELTQRAKISTSPSLASLFEWIA